MYASNHKPIKKVSKAVECEITWDKLYQILKWEFSLICYYDPGV